jgi:hypothetical protein
MRLTLIDSRTLGAAVCQPATDQWYNWSTAAWETPFSSSAHIVPLTPVEPAPSEAASVISADLGTVPFVSPDAAIVVFQLEPLAMINPAQLSRPISPPGVYGWPGF